MKNYLMWSFSHPAHLAADGKGGREYLIFEHERADDDPYYTLVLEEPSLKGTTAVQLGQHFRSAELAKDAAQAHEYKSRQDEKRELGEGSAFLGEPG